MKGVRNHLSYWTFVVHRLSGIALACFLPAHFWLLGTALRGEAALESMLRWTDDPWVKVAEWTLVVLLSAHFAGGLRILALELLPWMNWQKTLATLGAGFALAVGLAFALAL